MLESTCLYNLQGIYYLMAYIKNST